MEQTVDKITEFIRKCCDDYSLLDRVAICNEVIDKMEKEKNVCLMEEYGVENDMD